MKLKLKKLGLKKKNMYLIFGVLLVVGLFFFLGGASYFREGMTAGQVYNNVNNDGAGVFGPGSYITVTKGNTLTVTNPNPPNSSIESTYLLMKNQKPGEYIYRDTYVSIIANANLSRIILNVYYRKGSSFNSAKITYNLSGGSTTTTTTTTTGKATTASHGHHDSRHHDRSHRGGHHGGR